MNRMLAAAALGLLAATAPPPAQRAAPVGGSLVRLVTSDDYPNAALRNEEQGTVAFQLSVDAKGAVTACTITASSGSNSLDTTTCRLMLERARFTPAHNRRGRPVPDTVNQKISWRIAGGPSRDPALDAAAQAWADCLLTEAGRQAGGTETAATIADRAFAACPAAEHAMLAALSATAPPGAPPLTEVPPSLREGLRNSVLKRIGQLRPGAI